MTTKGRWILVAGVGIILAGIGIGEEVYRQRLQRRYEASEANRQRLQREFESLRADHEKTTVRLEHEQQRTHTLTDQLTDKAAELEEVVARLTAESRAVSELETRLAAMQEQMNQLQGELSLAIDEVVSEQADGSAPIQLERVVISSGSEPAGSKGRVVSIDESWSFVVIDLGWDTVKIGDTVSIFRHKELLAKARIERVQEGVAAATILPEWRDASIQVNDAVWPL